MATSLAEALAAAASVVRLVAVGRSLDAAFASATTDAEPQARPAIRDIAYGALRRYGRVQRIVQLLSDRPKPPEPELQGLLWCAFYALDSGRYAEYTVVDQAARACEILRRARAKPFVNALLRRFLRGRTELERRLQEERPSRHWYPAWWIDRLRTAYPERWEAILDAGNGHPPMGLRVNLRHQATEQYRRRLAERGMASSTVGPSALLLEKPVPVSQLPGFEEGDVSVQDLGAQQAAPLLDVQPGMRVLDACAAPGGKSAHLLELADLHLTALDADPSRLEDVRRTLERLRLRQGVEIRQADCSQLETWWDGQPYDRILADVPCSASGIVRRHPDIKWLRRAADLPAFAARQSAILDALWRALRPGGKLLYVTCSVFPEENGAVVDAFLARTPSAFRLPLPRGLADQWLPSAEHDGFFFALLEKQQ